MKPIKWDVKLDTKPFEDFRIAADNAMKAIGAHARALNLPAIRRIIQEEKQGYRYPDWIWHVEEQQRQQFGSGNGRKMRE